MSNNKDLMGYDPLEWLREENSNPAPEKAPVTPPVTEARAEELTPTATQQLSPAAPAGATDTAEAAEASVDLGGSLQIMDVAQLKPRLEESLLSLKEITLRADEGIVVDGAGMQLLLAYVLQAAASGVKLRWEALPPPISEAATLLNCEQVLLD